MLLTVLVALFSLTESAKFPKNWTSCKKDDPGSNECLKGAIQGALADLNDGSPALGVFPLEPLHFNQLTIDQGTGPVSIKLDFKDLDVIGIKNIVIENVKNDWKEMTLDVSFPKVVLDGKYKINGKVLILPVNGEGNCNLVLENYKGKAIMKFEEKETGGKKFYAIESFKITFDVDLLKMKFDSLFNGDKALGDNMNVFLNENWKQILQELKPSICSAFSSAFKDIGNRVFSKIEMNEISP